MSKKIIQFMFQFQHTVKLYHWQTKVYARHIAADHLLNKMTDLIDQYIEIYIGKKGRLDAIRKMDLEVRMHTDVSIIKYLEGCRGFLTDVLPKHLGKNDSDLVNIRDEMLVHINQALYLFTFK